MKNTLIFVEHADGQVADASLRTAGLAREMADKLRCELNAVVLGPQAVQLGPALEQLGADQTFICEDHRLAGYAPEAMTHLLASLIQERQPVSVFFAETSTGADLAVRLAARTRSTFASHCTGVICDTQGNWKATSLGYADKLQSIIPNPRIISVQQGIGEIKSVRRKTHVEHIKLTLPPDEVRLKFLRIIKADPRTVPLNQAEFIVSGGNGVRNFGTLTDLAARLNATVGGSRVVCDDGRLPRERQIGESGTTVTPRCYLAFGISGASQHLRGMQDSKLIISVNTDRYAPLMKIANMAVVADAEAVMREMLDRLNGKDSENDAVQLIAEVTMS